MVTGHEISYSLTSTGENVSPNVTYNNKNIIISGQKAHREGKKLIDVLT